MLWPARTLVSQAYNRIEVRKLLTCHGATDGSINSVDGAIVKICLGVCSRALNVEVEAQLFEAMMVSWYPAKRHT
jgi:hypothetical protein